MTKNMPWKLGLSQKLRCECVLIDSEPLITKKNLIISDQHSDLITITNTTNVMSLCFLPGARAVSAGAGW